MDSFIFNPTSKIDETVVQNYCLIGYEEFIDDDGFPRLTKESNKILAKKITKTGSSPQFYIKISNQNKLFNPLEGGLEDRAYSIVDNVCRPSDKFKPVNQRVFGLYLSFLSSKNIAWLNKAEREMI